MRKNETRLTVKDRRSSLMDSESKDERTSIREEKRAKNRKQIESDRLFVFEFRLKKEPEKRERE